MLFNVVLKKTSSNGIHLTHFLKITINKNKILLQLIRATIKSLLASNSNENNDFKFDKI